MKRRVAEHIEVEWLDPSEAEAECPNCGVAGRVGQILEIDYRPPDAAHRFVLQVCPVCSARFVDNMHTMDYSTELLIEIGWHVYQVQIGAGVWPISEPLTRVAKPAAARVLEIGGAYGFGLDFAVRAKGWEGVGYDPSPLAGFGARELGLDIRQAYFGEQELGSGPWDVVIATEVIEHLARPPEFMRLMRRALTEDGMLILTTPDAAHLTPALESGALLPLLSPGAHVVLQTAKSLEMALNAAGFAQVVVKRGGLSLVAYASAKPFVLEDDGAAGRALFRRYLVGRAALTDELSDLRLGFAGRGLFEAANDGDDAGAEAAWAELVPAVRARFGLDLAAPGPLPEGVAGASLAELVTLMPLGLGMILFGRAMQLIHADAPREALLPLLLQAKAAVDALQAALAQRSLTDGLTASIGRTLETEILLCEAELGRPACLPALLASGDEAVQWRGFVALVNAGAFALARELGAALAELPSAAIPTDLRRNALLSLANFALSPGGLTARAFAAGVALRELGEAADWVFLEAFTRLVNAGHYEAARVAAAKHGIGALAQAEGTAAEDARGAMLLLDVVTGDPAAIPGLLAQARIAPAVRDGLLVEAFVRLVNASRYDDALALLRDIDIARLTLAAGGAAARNVGLARMVLDLAVGDPAEIPGRLAGLEIEPARRDVLLLEAFVRLVNGSRFAEAFAFRDSHGVVERARGSGGEVAANAAIALAVLDLAAGDPADVPGRLAGADLPEERRDALLLGAFTGLVNAARYDEARAMRAAHACFTRLPEIDGEAAMDARLAQVLLDLAGGQTGPALTQLAELAARGVPEMELAPLWVDGFVRLVNEGAFAQAAQLETKRDIRRLLMDCAPALRADGLAAGIMLQLQLGDEPAQLLERFAAAEQGGLAPERREQLEDICFGTLVNRGAFGAARQLLARVEPRLIKIRPPLGDGDCNLLFAAGMLFLQSEDDWRRAISVLARLRDGLVRRKHPGETPDALFWPALRGEVVALNRLSRQPEAVELLGSFLAAYPGAPDDLLEFAARQTT